MKAAFAIEAGRLREEAGLPVELSAIIDRLERVMPKEYIAVWLSKPLEALNEKKPLDLIAAGKYRQLAEIISGIEDPGAV